MQHQSLNADSTSSPMPLVRRLMSLPEPLLVGFLLFLWLIATSWIRPLSLPDEGRYAGVAWEMVRSGDWLTPTLNGLPYFHKPPLFYWITAVSLSLFGTIEWAARLASCLGAMLGAGSAYLLIRRWMSHSISRWYLLILATMPLFFGGAQYANHDMLVAGFICMAIALTADAVLSLQASQPWRIQLLGGWLCAALGLLSKGLIGIVLPGGVLFFWILLGKRWRLLPTLFWWPGPLLFLLVASPWFLLMQQKFPDFFDYFFVYQHFHRFSQSAFNNAQPFWFFLAVIALTSLPWSPWLISRWRLKHDFHDTTTPALRHLFWLWIGVITLFFSIPTSKLVGYVLPVMPALAALIAEGVANVTRFSWRWKFAMVVIAATLCVGSIIAITRADDISSKPLVAAYRQNATPGEPLVFLQAFRFDVPFYARLAEPIIIIDNWDQPIVKDSWPKELADAAKFKPSAGEKVLINTPEMSKILCAQPVIWVISPTGYITKSKEFNSLEPVAKNSLYSLVKISSSLAPLNCQ
jgi:4-amino-4-deoxy-L-arabinose transferase-like glycosyltransferase